MKTKRLLILDGSIYTDAYRPVEQWMRHVGDTPVDAVHLPSGEKAPALDSYTHLLLTGSEASIVEHEPWYDIEVRLVREAVERGMPVLGSCFGHQMLTLALSGERHVGRSPTPEVGWVAMEQIDADPILAGFPDPCHCFSSHFDQVCEPSRPWRVLARSEGCAVQVMRYGERPVWGIQAHPEIDPDDARALLNALVEQMPEHAHLAEAALAQDPRDDNVAGILVRNFLASGNAPRAS